MSSSVGGRLEAVEPTRSLFGPDYVRLLALAIVSIAVHGWLISHTALTARDSLGFARQALCFDTPSAAPPHADGRAKTTIDHIRAAEHPPGFPLAVWATYKVTSLYSDAPIADRALKATQLANGFAALLLIVPTYLIGRMLFSRNVGFAAALLFQVLPVPARITSDGLTEGVYLLATCVAVMFAVRAVRQPRISGFLLCGLASGAAYLVRPEGVLVASGPFMVALWLGLTRRWPRDAAFGRITALAVGVALVAVPYMALIGKISNKLAAQEMLNPNAPPRSIYQGGPTSKLTTQGPLFAEWWNEERDAGKSRSLWAIQAVVKETSKSANYVIWPLAVFAILAFRRRFGSEPGLWILAVVACFNFALLAYLAARVGYVSERHTVLLTMIACQFAAAGLPWFAASIGQMFPRVERLGVRVTAASLLVLLVATSLPFALKTMHPNREGHKHAGKWLAANLKDDEAVVDPFCWAVWYSGRTLYRSSDYNPAQSRATYIVLENAPATPHSRLPVLPTAKELAAQPGNRVVYHWPENVPQDKCIVKIVKIGAD
jgi:4-amino-4-deoxy-L-arabinose transferase-like glycosyltransferase